MLYEIARRSIHLSKYEDIDLVWHNNVLTVRCDSGLHLFDFSYNLKCLDKTIDFLESKILTSRSSPADDLFPKNGIKGGIKNIELSEMVLDPSLWPHNKHLMEVSIIVTFEWSPVDFVHNNESVLATVNSAGNIDLYAQERNKWNKLENLSLKLNSEMELKIPKLISSISHSGQIDFKVIREAAYTLETSSICWCPNLNTDKSCFFVTAQKNGCIFFWLLKYEDTFVNATLLHHISDNKEKIVAMKWIPTEVNKFILICSDVLGQIVGYQCQIVDNVLEVLNINPLWTYKDKMIANYIQYESLNENIVIACNKHRHLLSLILDNNCRVLYQCVKNVNDQRITSVVKNNSRFYTSTVNREMYEVKFVIENECLDIHLVAIEVKEIPSVRELHSFAFSTNNVLLATALLDRTVLCRKLPLKLDIGFYSEENHELELNTITNNPTKSLTNVWDAIESFRCKTLRFKALPQLDYNKLYLDAKSDIFNGKLFLIFQTLYKNLENTIQNGSRGVLPETTIDDIKNNILACHAVQLINTLCISHIDDSPKNTDKKLRGQSLHMAHVYLKEFCSKNKMKINDLLPSDIVEILQKVKGSQYTCLWCDNSLKGFTCKDEHMNPFCTLTFTLIESNDYLVCRSCNSIARSDIYLDKPKCVFCDLYLCNCYLPL